MESPIYHRTVTVDGLPIFYREAGAADAPVLLLLHGFPSSSRMYMPLLRRLADRYRLIAPDYPGFGHSAWPKPAAFEYSFDRLAEVMTGFTESLSIQRYHLVMQDYGGPVGFRMSLQKPERVQSMVIQNAVAHDSGLSTLWAARRQFWINRTPNEAALRKNFLSLEATRLRHVGSDPDPERYDPDLWTDEFAFLNQPGQSDIQVELFYDYRNNVASYPHWQAWMRAYRPRMLVLWGRYDPSFDVSEPEAYRRDVPEAEIHILDAGHFAMDTAADAVAERIRAFL